MPKRKQPLALRHIATQKATIMLTGVLGTWTERLCLAADGGIQDYQQAVQYVQQQGTLMHGLLTLFPTEVLEDLSPTVIRSLVDDIAACDEDNWGFKPTSWVGEDMYNAVCTNMVKSVVVPSVTRCDMKGLTSGFAQKLIIKALNSAYNLTHLAFDTATDTDNSGLLAKIIDDLTNLQSFQYKYQCTDIVIQELGLRCKRLTQLDISYSQEVTDFSIYHLLKLKRLTDINLMETSISPEFYGRLISRLKNISILNSSPPICEILSTVSTEKLYTITCVTAPIHNTNILTQKCPRITTLTLNSVYEDLSSLTALNNLDELHLDEGDYVTSNMAAVLQGVGHRLNELDLRKIYNVNMADTVTLCSRLDVLVLECCTFVPLAKHTFLSSDLPHYKTVDLFLYIHQTPENEEYNRHLRYYVNLTAFMCAGVHIVTDDFVADAIHNGAFRYIVNFEVEDAEDGDLSMTTVELLLEHCEHLETLGYLQSWRRLTPQNISDLKDRILLQNLNLGIVL
jgi:hypothetical protein